MKDKDDAVLLPYCCYCRRVVPVGELLPLKGQRVVDPISKVGKDIGRCPQHQHESFLPVSWLYTQSKSIRVYYKGNWQEKNPSHFIIPDQHEFRSRFKRDDKGNTIKPLTDEKKCWFGGQKPEVHLVLR